MLIAALTATAGCEPSAYPSTSNVDLQRDCGNLSFNDTGDCVRELQRLLNERGAQLDENGNFNGRFGPNTREMVRQFQHARGVRKTGIAGEGTKKELYIRPLFGDWDLRADCVNMEEGAEGPCVVSLQNLLKLYGADLPEGSRTYGPRTTAAVREFQLNHDVRPVNGDVGPLTKDALYGRLPSLVPLDPNLEVYDCPGAQCGVYLDRATTASIANAFDDLHILKDFIAVIITELSCARLAKVRSLKVICAVIVQNVIEIITQFQQALKNQQCIRVSFQPTPDGSFKPVEFSQTDGQYCQG